MTNNYGTKFLSRLVFILTLATLPALAQAQTSEEIEAIKGEYIDRMVGSYDVEFILEKAGVGCHTWVDGYQDYDARGWPTAKELMSEEVIVRFENGLTATVEKSRVDRWDVVFLRLFHMNGELFWKDPDGFPDLTPNPFVKEKQKAVVVMSFPWPRDDDAEFKEKTFGMKFILPTEASPKELLGTYSETWPIKDGYCEASSKARFVRSFDKGDLPELMELINGARDLEGQVDHVLDWMSGVQGELAEQSFDELKTFEDHISKMQKLELEMGDFVDDLLDAAEDGDIQTCKTAFEEVKKLHKYVLQEFAFGKAIQSRASVEADKNAKPWWDVF